MSLAAPLLAIVLLGSAPAAGQNPPALTANDAVRVAMANSPHLRAARFGAQVAQAQTERSRPSAAPSVSLEARGQLQGPRVTFPRDSHGDATVIPEEYGRVALTLDQTLYKFGVNGGTARDMYRSQTRANELDVRRKENDEALAVRQAFNQVLTAESGVETAHQALKLAQQHLDLSRTMLQAGTAMERDVKASEADLADAQQGVIRADDGVALAKGNLNRLLGRDPDTPFTPVTPALSPAIPAGPEQGIALALRNRPEIPALEEGIRAARAGAALATTENNPTISARAVAAAETPTAFTSTHFYAAGVALTWNPFDSGKARADAMEARAKAGQLEAQLDEARLGIRLDVERAWRDMRDAQARIEAADRQIASAQAAYDISELRFQARSATQIEVSNALLNVTRARMNRDQAVTDLNGAWAEYLHATATGY